MVVIDIHLWPLGNAAKAKPLGHILVCNDGTGTLERGNYQAVCKHGGHYYGRPGAWKMGRVRGFNRNQDVYLLVLKILEACFSGPRGQDANTPEHARKLLNAWDVAQGMKKDAPLLDAPEGDAAALGKQVEALKLECETLRERVEELEGMLERDEAREK